MCMICVDFEAGKLTISECWRNLAEMESSLSEEHHDDIMYMLWDAEEEELNEASS